MLDVGNGERLAESGKEKKFYRWWIFVAAFLNLILAVCVSSYGFPVFYPALSQRWGLIADRSPRVSFLDFSSSVSP
jgi:hypothetical protein